MKARCRENCTPGNYKIVKDLWKAAGCTISYCSSEFDKQSRLHQHGIINMPSGMFRKGLLKEGFVIKFVPLKSSQDIKNWKEYCDKDQDILYDSKDDQSGSARITRIVYPYVMSSGSSLVSQKPKLTIKSGRLRPSKVNTSVEAYLPLLGSLDPRPEVLDILKYYKVITTK